MAFKTSSCALFFTLSLLFFNLGIFIDCSPTTNTATTTISNPTPTLPGTRRSLDASSGSGACPRDTLKFGVCANLLNKLLSVHIGSPPKEPCCALIPGVVDLEAGVCLCTAIKANVLGIDLVNLPVSLSLLINYCGSSVPSGFQCA